MENLSETKKNLANEIANLEQKIDICQKRINKAYVEKASIEAKIYSENKEHEKKLAELNHQYRTTTLRIQQLSDSSDGLNPMKAQLTHMKTQLEALEKQEEAQKEATKTQETAEKADRKTDTKTDALNIDQLIDGLSDKEKAELVEKLFEELFTSSFHIIYR